MSLLAKAERAVVEGRLQDAAAALNLAQKTNAADARIYLLGAELGRRAGNPGAAVMALHRAAALSPKSAPIRVALGKALELAGRPAEALAAYRLAHSLGAADGATATRIRALSEALNNGSGVDTRRDADVTARGDRRVVDADAARTRAAQLYVSGQLDEARAILQAAVEHHPSDIGALVALAAIERERGDTPAATRCLDAALALEPDNRTLQFQMAVLRGETPPDTPPEIVAKIFDAYADKFDEHLVGGLNYHAHEAVVTMMREHAGVATPDILDLGCGTGLVGAALSPPFGRLVGVDLSALMLDRARTRGLYTELHRAELVAYLQGTADQSFDAITAADVFVYIGDLGPGLRETARVLRARGVAVLSLEAASDAGYHILPSGRFTHHREYIERVVVDAGLELRELAQRQLRFQRGTPVSGYLVCVRRA